MKCVNHQEKKKNTCENYCINHIFLIHTSQAIAEALRQRQMHVGLCCSPKNNKQEEEQEACQEGMAVIQAGDDNSLGQDG